MEEYRLLGKIEHFSQLFVHDTFCHRGFTAHEGVYMVLFRSNNGSSNCFGENIPEKQGIYVNAC
ncbi:hypothetical protein AS888_04755 [Peribacillus simplex]|uniref:Uncharacterized protein n=1 Tax=Peribacillus simplex TaxID=1478 RepID=A0A120GQS4_9BACI|nr:hypothetical protein [Peribacillus simplex]KWW21811.1 hypothetical protein AS888_04755 [Peribacillus simplex]